MQLESAGRTDVGIRRRGRPNEDAFLVAIGPHDEGALLVVADGMGGAAAGDLASSSAISTMRQAMFGDDPGRDLVAAVVDANGAVRALASSDAAHAGAGTTLVGAYIQGTKLWVANVGDSRAYRVRDGKFEQLTIDHSYVQEEIDAGNITPEEARLHPRRNIITRNLGSQEQVEVDVTQWDVLEGDILLLCSDGLWGSIDDPELQRLVASDERPLKETVDLLVQAANAAGGVDNITAVVARIGELDAHPESAVLESSEPVVPARSARGCARAAVVAALAGLLLLALPLALVAPSRRTGGGRAGRRSRG